MAEPAYRYEVIDLPELDGCGGVAFIYVSEREPRMYDRIDAENVRWPDGREGQAGEVMRCGACGRELAWPEVGRMTAFIVAPERNA